MRVAPHWLPPNKSSALPRDVIYLDTETRATELSKQTVEHTLRLGAALYVHAGGSKQAAKEEWLDFTRPHDVWAWVEERSVAGRRIVVLAHNAGFDLQVLGGPALLASRGWTITKAIIDHGRLIIRAQRDGAGLLLLDFANYFPAPLEQAAMALGLDKIALPAEDAPAEAWRARCRRDVEILRAAFERWLQLVRDADLGHFAETLPKQAMNGYRHRFLESQQILMGDPRAADLERAAYFGGRTEAYRLGQLPAQPWHKLDSNSHYAAAMRGRLYPTRLAHRIVGLRVEALPRTLRKYAAIARVRIKTDLPIYPLRLDGRLVFPVGTFVTTLATPELAEAARRGHLVEIGKCALYEKADLFTAWVDALYGLRAAARARGDELTAELAGRVLQGLYGRFGMRFARWTKEADEPGNIDELYRVWDVPSQRHRTFRRLGGRLEVKGEPEDSEQAMIAIPAHVASAGRLQLWRWIEQAGEINVAYSDTDSLIVSDDGHRRLAAECHPTELGKLKDEGTELDVYIGGPKLYRFGALERHKGIRDSARDLGQGRWRQEEWVSFARSLQIGHDGGPLVRLVERTLREGMPGREVRPDGSTAPLDLRL